MRKICIYCNKRRNPKSFSKHSHSKDDLDSRCKKCIKRQTKLRKKLYKNSPAKPECCECCGKIPDKWCLDHDHKSDSFRGWLCSSCNTAIGQLGDDLAGVVNAMNYLLSKQQNLKSQNRLDDT
jgi:hypothetical protein